MMIKYRRKVTAAFSARTRMGLETGCSRRNVLNEHLAPKLNQQACPVLFGIREKNIHHYESSKTIYKTVCSGLGRNDSSRGSLGSNLHLK